MWKDFFYFTRQERRGILVLLGLIIVTASAWQICRKSCSEQEESLADSTAYLTFKQAIEKIPYRKKAPYTPSAGQDVAAPPVVLQTFDPNTADSATFRQLGLPAWVTGNILKYRKKKGRFRRAEDFRKIYGLSPELYRTLLPYIRIAPLPETSIISTRDTTPRLYTRADSIPRVVKYTAGTTIDLNRADTAELKKIPGIGSVLAKRIIGYRKSLGGFYAVEQLSEINLRADLLKSWFKLPPYPLRKINLNTASLERIMRHPYFNFYQAKAIVEYRQKKGRLTSLKQLSLYEEFTAADIERQSRYAEF